MPNSKQHREKADHNKAFLSSIATANYADWAVVVAFYTAVHLVERLRTKLPTTICQHSTDHQDRLQFVQKHHRAIHKPYHQIFNASLIARYQTLGSFNAQFSTLAVEKTLIGRYLTAIEEYVRFEFPTPPTEKVEYLG